MGSSSRGGRVLILLYLSCLLIPSYSATDTLDRGKQLRFGELLESSNNLFKLGFFQFDRYYYSFLGIWYNDTTWYRDGDDNIVVQYPVWIANRNAPIFDKSTSLSVEGNGSLQILSSESEVIALYSSTRASIHACATLQNDGNFLLHELNSDGSVKRVLWQSFDHPTDTLLPGMKLGINWKTGLTWNLTSREVNDVFASPSFNSFTLGMNPNGTKELIMWRLGEVYWRSGLWQQSISDFPSVYFPIPQPYSFNFTQNENETYFYYTANQTSQTKISFPRIRIASTDVDPLNDSDWSISGGVLMIYSANTWTNVVSCNYTLPFVITSGCINRMLPECTRTIDDYGNIIAKRGSMSNAGFIISESHDMTIDDCKAKCLLNCSCFAYAATNSEDQTGCEIWTSRAIFITTKHGRNIYILPSKGNKWWLWLTLSVGGIMIIPTLCSVCYIIWRQFTSHGDENINQRTLIKELEGDSGVHSFLFGKPKSCKKYRNELHVFSFESIVSATNYFSAANKLGEGGFGPVYKGMLLDGREVAIKRLSRSSGQGMVEFKNEALLIAKLQHTNLVRLLGFCIQGEEKILIYQYMRNKSLDSVLFDPVKKKMLNWKRRFVIIEGVAQGLLYLHKYSRLRVIHRDLKASNILLDDEMNPKISDFGLARIFEQNEYEANTNRVVGTYGYMSPEYAFHGLVSIKTDVFSFGVLLLEVVSGRKSTGRYHPEHPLNLSGYVWQLWNEDRALELIDPSMDEFCPHDQILRCIHIGLLCVQDHAIDRPTMSDIVSMLSNETMPLPKPKQPAFFTDTRFEENTGVPEIKSENCSINHVTISDMEAR
ncbi:hypothetical protein SLEP1_g50675 [Rubroshorea leprosula]|uniref:Receptor-like serine/threonine-protein kinase n=2 Tax=Rubroshorea leprosula TaxID=152421 RepID=A0AAV5M4A0_9ROSI|nr:hypothetical protein SLEP1_g50675 [Rubroshorea leprosula]